MITIPDLETWRASWSAVAGGWVMADGFSGIEHPVDGRYLIVCGDTFHERAGKRTATNSSAVLVDPDGALTLVSDPVAGLIPRSDPESWYWHGDLVWGCPDLWMFALRVRAVPTNVFGFERLPRDLLQFAWPSWGRPTCVARWSTPEGPIDWGASAISRPPWIYVYGVYQESGWYGQRVYLARVPVGQLPHLDRWRYRGPRGAWVADPEAAQPVIDHVGGPGNTFSTDYVNNTYMIVSKRDGDLGSEVQRWTSTTPWGPWTITPIASEPWREQDMTYGAYAHTGLRLPDGRALVSVPHNRLGASIQTLYADPGLYRPAWHPATLPGVTAATL